MSNQDTITLKEAIRDIDFAVNEPYNNAKNSEGPTYRDLITSMTAIKVIVNETKTALFMR